MQKERENNLPSRTDRSGSPHSKTAKKRARLSTAGLILAAIGLYAVWDTDTAPKPPQDLSPRTVHAEQGFLFTTLDKLLQASDAVIVGRVLRVGPGREIGGIQTPTSDRPTSGIVTRIAEVEVERLLAGSIPRSYRKQKTAEDPTKEPRQDPKDQQTSNAAEMIIIEEEGWTSSGHPLVIPGMSTMFPGERAIFFLWAGRHSQEAFYSVVNNQGKYTISSQDFLGDGTPGDSAQGGKASERLIPSDRTDPLAQELAALGSPALQERVLALPSRTR